MTTSTDRIVAYVGAERRPHGGRDLTDWHGKVIGRIDLTSSWKLPPNAYSDRMYQGYAEVDGVTYTGRTMGEGMSFYGKPVSRAKRRR